MKKIATIVVLLSIAMAAMAQEAPKKYELKSGFVKVVTQVMDQKTETTSFFDDYGAKEITKSKVSVPGGDEMEIATIQKDDKMYVVNYTAKQVQEVPVQESINYLDLTEEIVEKYKIKEEGKEELGDRECTKYSLEIVQMGQKAQLTVWVWKGYTIKSVTKINKVEITAEVVELVEDCTVLPMTFDVPEF